MKMAHPFGERALVKQADSNEQMALDSLEGRFHVRWSPDEAVTSLGQVPFFHRLPEATASRSVRSICYSLSVAVEPPERTKGPGFCILGTLLLSIVAGGHRYAHVNALRHDGGCSR